MTVQPDIDVANHLGTILPQLTVGTNLFAGPMRPYSKASEGGMPHQAIFCLETGGKPPTTYKNAQGDGYQLHMLEYPTVQIAVRSDPFGFLAARNLCAAIMDTVNRVNPDALYIDSQVNDGSPNYLGTDDDGHHMWSINVDLTYDFLQESVYFGIGPAASSGEPFITGLANTDYASFRYRTFSLTTGAAEKMYYAFPASYADVGTVAFDTAFTLTSVDLIDGVSYNLYESDAGNLGLVTVNVT